MSNREFWNEMNLETNVYRAKALEAGNRVYLDNREQGGDFANLPVTVVEMVSRDRNMFRVVTDEGEKYYASGDVLFTEPKEERTMSADQDNVVAGYEFTKEQHEAFNRALNFYRDMLNTEREEASAMANTLVVSLVEREIAILDTMAT